MGFWAFGRRRKRRKMSESEQQPVIADRQMVEKGPAAPSQTFKWNERPRGPELQGDGPTNRTLPTNRYTHHFDLSGPEYARSPVYQQHGESSKSTPPRARHSTAPHKDSVPPPAGLARLYLRDEDSGSDRSFSRPTSWSHAPTLMNTNGSRGQVVSRSGSRKSKNPVEMARLHELRNSRGPVPIPIPQRRFIEDEVDETSKSGKGAIRTRGSAQEKHDSGILIAGRQSAELSYREPRHTRAIKVRSLDVLQPHPTLRSELGPSDGYRSRPNSQRLAEPPKTPRTPIAGTSQRKSKRIDELADDLDAAMLRQLMERDQRRREEKRHRQSERAKRKLLDLEAKQRLDESERIQELGDQDDERATQLALDALTMKDPAREHPSTQAVETIAVPRNLAKPVTETSSISKSTSIQPVNPGLVTQAAQSVGQSSPFVPPPLSKSASGFRSEKRLSPPPPLPLSSDRIAAAPSAAVPERPDELTRRQTKTASGSKWASLLKPLNRHKSKESDAASTSTPMSVRYSETGSNSDFSVNRQASGHTEFRPPYSGTSIRRRSGTPTRAKSRFREDLPGVPPHGSESRLGSGDSAADMPGILAPLPIPTHRFMAHRQTSSQTDVPPSPMLDEARGHRIRKSASGLSYEPGEELSYSQSYASVDSESSWIRPSRRTSKLINQSSRSSINTSRRHTHDGMEIGESLNGLDVLAERDAENDPERENGTASSNAAGATSSATIYPDHMRHDGYGRSSVSELDGDHFRPTELSADAPERVNGVATRGFSKTPSNPFEADGDSNFVLDSDFNASLEDLDQGVAEKAKHARHVSAGSAKLLDIVSSGLDLGSKRSSRLEPTLDPGVAR